MASMNPTLQLCLIHNDPMSTLLITPDGEAMYSIHTPGIRTPFPSSPSPTPSPSSSTPAPAPAPAAAPIPNYALLSSHLAPPERASTFPPSGLASTLHPSLTSEAPPIERATSLPHTSSPHPLASSAQSGLNEHTISNIANIISSLSHSPRSASQREQDDEERITTITRLERTHSFGHGHVATEIGVINFHPANGAKITIPVPLPPNEHMQETFELLLPPVPKPHSVIHNNQGCPRRDGVLFKNGKEEGECEHENECGMEVWQENEWEFTGPDDKRYKWQMFVQCPILVLTSPSQQQPTPLARYRRAKLGIVSRSRRASLEVFPAGMNAVDLIVVSFVGFMRRIVG